jgi:hypothetical protein
MYDWNTWIWVLIPLVALIGAFTSGIVATVSRARVRELEIRERIAMIEKGLVPPPEVDPGGFDRAMSKFDRHADLLRRRESRGAGRHRRAGITLLGVGLGLMLLISFAGEAPQTGFGVGGFIAMIGLAFFINSLFEDRHQEPATPATPTEAPRPD